VLRFVQFNCVSFLMACQRIWIEKKITGFAWCDCRQPCYRIDGIFMRSGCRRWAHRGRKQKFDMDPRLYVGNLSRTTAPAELDALFTQAVIVTATAGIRDRKSGESKGWHSSPWACKLKPIRRSVCSMPMI
jgi:hypothetical protein